MNPDKANQFREEIPSRPFRSPLRRTSKDSAFEAIDGKPIISRFDPAAIIEARTSAGSRELCKSNPCLKDVFHWLESDVQDVILIGKPELYTSSDR